MVLVHLMDRVQKDFVRRIEGEMLPNLEAYSTEAEQLIGAAEENMERGGDPAIGMRNIESNELTIQATELYAAYLRDQAAAVRTRNEQLQVTLRDAQNTYQTVALSSQVAAILKEGQRNFAALLRLDLPPLRGFDNAELRAEFERLTQRMADAN